MENLSTSIASFIDHSTWIFAKTYANTWPHEYIVQENTDSNLFLQLAHHIDTFGYEAHFYTKKIIYYDYNGMTYWHMENIINRCLISETYWAREKAGSLPN